MSDAIVRSTTGCTRATRPGAPSSRGAGAGGTRRTLTREGTVFKKKNKMKFERASGEARTLPLATRFTHESGRAELEAIMSIVRARGSFPTSRPVRAETCDPPVVVANSAHGKKTRPGLTAWLSRSARVRVSIAKQRWTAHPRGLSLGPIRGPNRVFRLNCPYDSKYLTVITQNRGPIVTSRLWEISFCF